MQRGGTRLRLGIAAALAGLAAVAVLVAVPALERAAAGQRPRAAATPAPNVLSTAGLSGRAWFVSAAAGWVLVEVPTAGLPRMELLSTADAGVTFQRTLAWDGGAAPETLRLFDANRAFVAVRVRPEALHVFTTLDGVHWRGGDSPSPAAGVSFVDPSTGWAAYRRGASVVVDRTADGGQTWSHLATFAAPPEVDPHAWLDFVDARDGLMGSLAPGRLASLYATHDGGATWAPVALPPPAERVGAAGSSVLSGIAALSADGPVPIQLTIFPRQGDRHAHSYLYVSSRGLGGWSQPRALPAAEWQAAGQERLVATSGRVLFTSRDGARTWRSVRASLPLAAPANGAAFQPFQFVAPAFLDDRVGWATLVATQRCEGGAHPQTCAEHPEVRWAIARTTDGGSTWSLVDAHA